MTDKIRIKTIVAVTVIILLIASFFFLLNRKEEEHIYSRLATEEEKQQYTEYVYKDYSNLLFCGDSPAAIDIETSSVYLSVTEESLETEQIFINSLYLIDSKNKELLFVFEEDNKDIRASVANNTPFKLIVADVGCSNYMEYNVYLSTLPIIRLDGGVVGQNDVRRPIHEGDFSIWNGDSQNDGYLKTSIAQWNIRGGSSTRYDKNSFRISLIKRNEENSMSLLDLGTDDNWILNAMVVDDLKIREKFTMDIWNSMQESSSYKQNMSIAQYVEVIINGKYEGLYLLQRKIDEEYLELPQDSVLLRGADTYAVKKPVDAYSIEYSHQMSANDIYEDIAGVFNMNDFSDLCMDNWIDMNLYVQFGNMLDNRWVKNSYYTINARGNQEIGIIPWDTDASFGIMWGADNFFLDYSQTSKEMHIVRSEYESILNMFPGTKKDMDDRWCELRKTVLTDNNIRMLINGYVSVLRSSGSLTRDQAENGKLYGDNDSVEDFTDFVSDRLDAMDDYYNY